MPEQVQPEAAVKFDLRTHVWDARGRLKSKNSYRLHIENGSQYFERPVNSGNLYYENNEPAGRVEMVKDEKGKPHKKFDFEAAHKAYTAPLSGAEKMHYENESLKEQNAKLLAEIEAIKAEQDKKAAVQTKPVQAPNPAAGGPRPASTAITKDIEL